MLVVFGETFGVNATDISTAGDNASCDRGNLLILYWISWLMNKIRVAVLLLCILRSAVLQHGAEQALCHYRNVGGMYYAFCSILYCYRAGASLSDHVCQKAEYIYDRIRRNLVLGKEAKEEG